MESGQAPQTTVGRFYHPELGHVALCSVSCASSRSTPGPNIHSNGWIAFLVKKFVISLNFGVDVFFLLSAYLITELLRRERIASGAIHIRAFYVRRMLRIWPLYFGFLLLCYVLWPLFFPEARLTSGRLAAFLLLAGNWYTGQHGFTINPISPLWSISLEEQFYLFWPSLSKPWGGKALYILCPLLFALAWIALWFLTAYRAERSCTIWVNSLVQFQFFAAGGLLALVLKGRICRFRPLCRAALLCVGPGAWDARQRGF